MTSHQRRFRRILRVLVILAFFLSLISVVFHPVALGLPPGYLTNKIDGTDWKALTLGLGDKRWIPCAVYPENPLYFVGHDPHLRWTISQIGTLNRCLADSVNVTAVPNISPEYYTYLMETYPYVLSGEYTAKSMLTFDVPVNPDTPVWITNEEDWIVLIPQTLLPDPLTFREVPVPIYVSNTYYAYMEPDDSLLLYVRHRDGTGELLYHIQLKQLSGDDVVLDAAQDDNQYIQLLKQGQQYRLLWIENGEVLDDGFIFEVMDE